MNKIINYITNGSGLGVKYLLVFSLLMSVFVGIFIRISGGEMIPYAQSVADQLLPVKIENGIVVEPNNTVKTAYMRLGNRENLVFPFTINTTTDTLDPAHLRPGMYLTRTTLYAVNQYDTRIIKIQDNAYLPKADYSDVFKSLLNWVAFFSAIICTFLLFVFYFILALFYSVCAIAVSAVASKKLDFDLRMRLSSLCLIAAYLLFIPLTFVSLGNSKLFFFIVVIALQAYLIKKLPIIPAVKEEQQESPETPQK